MNIGSVSSSCAGASDSTRQDKFKTIRQDFKDLQSALKSGDLKAAQDAYAKLKQDLPAKSSSDSSSGQGQFGTDLDAIGSALQSNDLSGAQKAFATFQQDAQAARGAHGHHHHHQDSDGDGDNSTSSGSTTTNIINGVTLNAQA